MHSIELSKIDLTKLGKITKEISKFNMASNYFKLNQLKSLSHVYKLYSNNEALNKTKHVVHLHTHK